MEILVYNNNSEMTKYPTFMGGFFGLKGMKQLPKHPRVFSPLLVRSILLPHFFYLLWPLFSIKSSSGTSWGSLVFSQCWGGCWLGGFILKALPLTCSLGVTWWHRVTLGTWHCALFSVLKVLTEAVLFERSIQTPTCGRAGAQFHGQITFWE